MDTQFLAETLENFQFDPAICLAAELAHQASIAALIKGSTKKILEKQEEGIGQHQAIVTVADLAAQNLIIEGFTSQFPEMRFLAEEESKHQNIITDPTPEQLFQGLVAGIDGIDGTPQHLRNLYEWSTSIGIMKDRLHLGGAISAPAILGGTVVVGERGKGVFLIEQENLLTFPLRIPQDRKIRESLVYTGVDLHFLDQYQSFEKTFAKEVLGTKSTGSCAIGLMFVAAGRVDALIQPVQGPWDWFAGYPLVEEAGGKFQFYHYRKGKPVALPKPDLDSYLTSRRNVAFIAGRPDLVDWLFERLQNNWR